jgi:hypothetical protein
VILSIEMEMINISVASWHGCAIRKSLSEEPGRRKERHDDGEAKAVCGISTIQRAGSSAFRSFWPGLRTDCHA